MAPIHQTNVGRNRTTFSRSNTHHAENGTVAGHRRPLSPRSFSRTSERWLLHGNACFDLILFLCLILTSVGRPATIFAGEPLRVLVLPFKVYSVDNVDYLRHQIPAAISDHLTREGTECVSPDKDELDTPDIDEPGRIADLAVRFQADSVLWGSLTYFGQAFSVDARILDTRDAGKGVRSFHVEGQGVETLLVGVQSLAVEIGIHLLHLEKIEELIIEGNRRIEGDAIRRVIVSKAGDPYVAASLSRDLRAIYDMGYFEDIRIEAENGETGKRVRFIITEKPTIRKIIIKGNHAYDTDKLMESLTIKSGSILNIFNVRSNIARIRELYREKNYHNAGIEYRLIELKNNQADLEFTIDEGRKIKIKRISFQGNSAYSSKELRKKAGMKTKRKGFWSWLTSSGELKIENLNQDIARITALYHNSGYIDARVADPEIDYRDEWIFITIKIEEGRRYGVGKVDLLGDLIRPREELLQKITLTGETYFNRGQLRTDVLALTDIYQDEGYFFVEIVPKIDKDEEAGLANLSLTIHKGGPVMFDRILISGNTKTRDKVIRRELPVHEQERYSGSGLKRGIRNLYRLDYFEDIKVNTLKGQTDDKMILKLDVSEKPTGMFTFGGGYSSVENLFAMVSVTQQNFLGRGQILQVKGELGGTTTRYTLGFTEPWLFDIPLSAGFDVYKTETDYDLYTKDTAGGGLRLGYPVYDYTRLYLSYSYEVGDIYDISYFASDSIWELMGKNTTSSASITLNYDSRDRMFNATEGSNHRVSMESAGGLLGGDMAFTKYIAETGWYFPLFWQTVFFIHGEAGYVQKNSGGMLPDYERFYLGGMNSLRGFDWRDICVRVEGPYLTPERPEDGHIIYEIGGNKYIQFNIEYLIPLVKQAGLMGVFFFDTGNVAGSNQNLDIGNLRQSAGYGIRWYSPIGPIRLENGYILDRKEGEKHGGRWEFTMGQAF